MATLATLFADLSREQVALAALLDRELMLRELARHAVEVTGADLAFFAERREGAVQIRHLSGHETDALVDLDVPFGRGVGGLCASQRRVVVVPDYYNASNITHDFDARVRAEGLKSVVAAPLVAGDEVQGVLYIATRQETGFGERVQREVVRLSRDTATALDVSARARDTMEAAVYDDRRQLAVRLHDSVGQMLFGIGAAARDLGAETESDPNLHERITRLEQQVWEAAATLREAMTAWSVPPVERELAVSLCEDVHAFQERSGVGARFLVLSEIPALPDATSRALLLACREALLNVEKHAQATGVVVTLYCTAGGIGVAIVDDGRGHRPDDLPGIGVHACRERLERLGGSLSLTGDDEGSGTTLRAWVPC